MNKVYLMIICSLVISCFCQAEERNAWMRDEESAAAKKIVSDLDTCVAKVKAKKDVIMSELRACVDGPYDASEKQLEKVYQAAIKQLKIQKVGKTLEAALKENELDSLVKSQADFKKYTQSRCKYRSMAWNGGSHQGSIELQCLLFANLDRIDEIESITLKDK